MSHNGHSPWGAENVPPPSCFTGLGSDAATQVSSGCEQRQNLSISLSCFDSLSEMSSICIIFTGRAIQLILFAYLKGIA